MLQETGSAAQLAVVVASTSIVTLSIMPFAAALLDRRTAIRWLIAADGASLVTVAGLVTFSQVLHDPFPAYLIGAVLLAAALALSAPALPTFLGALVTSDQVPRAMARAQLGVRFARIGGPLIGGVLIAAGGFVAICLVNGATFLVSALCWWLISRQLPNRPESDRPGGGNDGILAGVRYALSSRTVRWIIGIALLVNPTINLITVLLPVFVDRTLAGGPEQCGLLQATFQAGMLGVSATFAVIALPRWLGKTSWGVGASVAGLVLSFLGIAAAGSIWLAAPAVLAAGWFLMLTALITDSRLIVEVPEGLRGRVFGLVTSLAGALRPVGALLGGAAVAVASASVGIALAGLLCVGLGIAVATRRALPDANRGETTIHTGRREDLV